MYVVHFWAIQDKVKREKTIQGVVLRQPEEASRLTTGFQKYCAKHYIMRIGNLYLSSFFVWNIPRMEKNINKKFSLLCMKPSTFQSTLLLTTNVNRPVESVISKTVHYMPWNMHAVLLCFSWIPASHTQLVISFSDFVCSWSKHAIKWLVSTNTSS